MKMTTVQNVLDYLACGCGRMYLTGKRKIFSDALDKFLYV
jgi:hypothetical protein